MKPLVFYCNLISWGYEKRRWSSEWRGLEPGYKEAVKDLFPALACSRAEFLHAVDMRTPIAAPFTLTKAYTKESAFRNYRYANAIKGKLNHTQTYVYNNSIANVIGFTCHCVRENWSVNLRILHAVRAVSCAIFTVRFILSNEAAPVCKERLAYRSRAPRCNTEVVNIQA